MKTPLPNTYWVEPGKLLAGEHPDGGSEAGTRARLETLLAAGVRGFIDLTQTQELPSYRGLLPDYIDYQNFPMPDHALPESAAQMREVQDALLKAMQAGTVYVHCRAGIGRTGMTVGCYLRGQGESPMGAVVELNRLWQQNARASSWPSTPETEEQERFIRDWLVPLQQVGSRQRQRGCLVTLAIGDALVAGAARETAQAWTDDTGMTLCVAESLLDCGGFDGRDQLERYRNWAVDPAAAGAAPDATLRVVVRDVLARSAWKRGAVQGSHDPAQLDASPLARSAACALFAAGNPAVAAALAADTTRVTHQAPLLVDACRLLAAMIAQALAGSSRELVLATADRLGGAPLRDEVRALAAGWLAGRSGRRRPQTAALGALDRAVRCFSRSRGVADGMERALDSPDTDKDAVCAVYGALAGAHYGEEAIEPALRRRVANLAMVERIADRLWQREGAHEVTA